MAADPYTTLGVKKDASQDEIQKAYRRLAKKLHPDLNPGNKTAEDKFKEVSVAYDLLSDPDKRARFDRGEIDASGTERPRQQYYRDFADQDGWSAYTSNAGYADFGDFAGTEDILSEIFGREGRAGRRKIRRSFGLTSRRHLQRPRERAGSGKPDQGVPPFQQPPVPHQLAHRRDGSSR